MGDDIFDVVDESDRVIGQAPRREVHARGLHHRATHILVHDAAGRVFLQRRSLDEGHLPRLLGFLLQRPRRCGRGLRNCRAP